MRNDEVLRKIMDTVNDGLQQDDDDDTFEMALSYFDI